MKDLSLGDLQPADYNPRKISAEAAAGLALSLDKFGDISGIVWNKRTGRVVAGHQRIEQLRQQGAQLVDGALVTKRGGRFSVRVVDWDESTEKAANIAANNPHIGGEWTENLEGLLEEVRLSLGEDEFTTLVLDKLAKDVPFSLTEVNEDVVPEPPKVPVTKLGDVWVLGDHRLVCGDSTNAESFSHTSDIVDCVWTDPPYGVSYVGKTKSALTIENDTLEGESLFNLLNSVFEHCIRLSRPGASWYVAAPSGVPFLEFARVLSKHDIWRHTLIWLKQTFSMGRCDYHYRHEAIFYGWKPGGPHCWKGGRSQDSVLEFDKPAANREHPTMKPVGLIARCIENSSNAGDSVLDPFAGSGTTLIACEQLGRRGIGLELSPAYCDVIVERWENLTGGKAKRA